MSDLFRDYILNGVLSVADTKVYDFYKESVEKYQNCDITNVFVVQPMTITIEEARDEVNERINILKAYQEQYLDAPAFPVNQIVDLDNLRYATGRLRYLGGQIGRLEQASTIIFSPGWLEYSSTWSIAQIICEYNTIYHWTMYEYKPDTNDFVEITVDKLNELCMKEDDK